MRRQALEAFLGVILLLGITGCAATTTALKYKDLDVQTKMSDTIFLDPVAPDQKVVWIGIKNTSDKELDLSPLTDMLRANGYRVVADPEQARYHLQANVLYVGRAAPTALEQSVGAGFGGPLAGAAIGAGSGALIGRSGTAIAVGAGVGGLLGAAAESVSGSLVKAVTYTILTDVQLSERSAVPVAQAQTANLTQGTQTQVRQEVAEISNWKRYRTRIATSATKVNLEFEEAQPVIVQGLLRSLAGLL